MARDLAAGRVDDTVVGFLVGPEVRAQVGRGIVDVKIRAHVALRDPKAERPPLVRQAGADGPRHKLRQFGGARKLLLKIEFETLDLRLAAVAGGDVVEAAVGAVETVVGPGADLTGFEDIPVRGVAHRAPPQPGGGWLAASEKTRASPPHNDRPAFHKIRRDGGGESGRIATAVGHVHGWESPWLRLRAEL